MNNSGFMKDQKMVISGVNALGLVSLLAYVIRSFNEVNQSIEEIRTEFSTLKTHINENNKRANISFNRLNQKIDDTTINYKRNNQVIEHKIVDVSENLVRENKSDEITSAINSLMG